METERIAELGTTLAAKSGQDKITHGGSVKVSHRVSRGPGDLVDSYNDSNEQSGYGEYCNCMYSGHYNIVSRGLAFVVGWVYA